jgi:hypothetical protein
MPVSISGTNGVTFPDSSLQAAAASPNVLKNRIINGAMTIDQRNNGASVSTASSSGIYTVDRWITNYTQFSKYTAQQNAGSVTPPVGFSNYLGITSSSAYSVVASDTFTVRQYIEGYNMSDLDWGTANAKTITLSFWVRSSLTGTFGGSILNYAGTRSYPFSYTISAANTWEQKSVTIAGDTGGTWVGATNAGAAIISFGLGSGSTYSGTAGSWSSNQYYQPTGSTSVVGTNGATFYITGVQLEQNTSATPFERRLYNQELANCQRYFQLLDGFVGGSFSGTTIATSAQFKTEMRATPTFSLSAALQITYPGVYDKTQSSANVSIQLGRVNARGASLDFANFSSLTNNVLHAQNVAVGGTVLISAEL